MLLMLPVAYRLAEEGRHVGLSSRPKPSGWPRAATMPLVSDLPHLPLLSGNCWAEKKMVPQFPLDWTAEGRGITELVCEDVDADLHIGSTPATACLVAEDWHAEYVKERIGAPYVLLALGGHTNADRKAMTQDQVDAVTEAARKHFLPVVAVHSTHLELPTGIVNLTGETTLAELVALTSQATAVVAPDSGVMHLAQAFEVPTVAVVAGTLGRTRVSGYRPLIWLQGKCMADVDAGDVGKALTDAIGAARITWAMVAKRREPCGVVEVGSLVAEAGGVEFGYEDELPDADVLAIEGHGYDAAMWAELAPNLPPHILSVHAGRPEAFHDPDAVVFRGRELQERWAAVGEPKDARTAYIPLPCLPAPCDLHLNSHPRTVVWQGMAREDKNVPILADAFEIVRKRLPDAKLILAASTNDASARGGEGLASHIAALGRRPSVELVYRRGWTRAEVVEQLARADLFCYPDILGCAEQSAASPYAMSYGKPVIVSPSSKHRDVAPWCVTADPTPEALAEAMLLLMTDRVAYAAAAARVWQGASYRQPEIIARQFRSLAQQVWLDRRRGATK
jgi:hypothetical protein